MGMRTALLQARTVSSDRPCPSLPITVQRPPGPGCTGCAPSSTLLYSAAASTSTPRSRSFCTACAMLPTSSTGMRAAAPMLLRSVLGLHGEAQPSDSSTASKPNAAAERISVPTLPGSCTRSKARNRAPPCFCAEADATVSQPGSGIPNTANTPWLESTCASFSATWGCTR